VSTVVPVPVLACNAFLALLQFLGNRGTFDGSGDAAADCKHLLERASKGDTTAYRRFYSGAECGAGSSYMGDRIGVTGGNFDLSGDDLLYSAGDSRAKETAVCDVEGNDRRSNGDGAKPSVTVEVSGERGLDRLPPRGSKRNRARERKNRKLREAEEKVKKVEIADADLPEHSSAAVYGGGFWESCTPEMREKLIASKARMHVAENERREEEAKSRSVYLRSPQALLERVAKVIDLKEKYGDGETKVGSWINTVASESTESIARSAPASIPSLDSIPDDVIESVPERELCAQLLSVFPYVSEIANGEKSFVAGRTARAEGESAQAHSERISRLREAEQDCARECIERMKKKQGGSGRGVATPEPVVRASKSFAEAVKRPSRSVPVRETAQERFLRITGEEKEARRKAYAAIPTCYIE